MQEATSLNAIMERYQEWMQAIREKDLNTILDIYADDATYMPPGKPSFQGKEALKQIWTSYLQRDSFTAVYTPSIQLSNSEDMAYDIGQYRIMMRKDGKQVAFEGKYVLVWKRLSGAWKVAVDIDNDSGATE